jgi:hypothetical protein
MILPLAITLMGVTFVIGASRKRPADRESATDGWWWLRFMGLMLLTTGGLLWLIWIAIRLIFWIV